MGYSISHNSIDRWRNVLDLIMKHQDVTLRIKTKSPEELSYQIHQAIASAKELNVEPYNKLSITISRRKDHILVKHKKEMVLGIEVEKEYVKVEDPTDHFGVVAQATQHDFDTYGMVFQSFVGNIEIVDRWATGRGLTVTNREPLTLERNNDG